MMDYFNARKNSGQDADRQMDGFKYAYLYPGINKVFQAAGRVIRTEKDRGVILLLDERFGRREYNELFPVEWQDTVFGSRKRTETNVGRILERISGNILNFTGITNQMLRTLEFLL